MAFSREVSSDCGTTNGAKHLMKQLGKDTSLQKDGYFQQGENSGVKGFRTTSSPVLSSDNLAHEFFKHSGSSMNSPFQSPSNSPIPLHSPSPFQSPSNSPFRLHSPSPFQSRSSSPQLHSPRQSRPHSPQLHSPSPIPSKPVITEGWIHEFQEKTRISSPLIASSTYKEFDEIHSPPPQQQWTTGFHQPRHSSKEEELVFNRAFEKIVDPIPESDWSKAFQQYDYIPDNPYIKQPEYIQQAINTTPSDTVMALEAESQLYPGDAQVWYQLGIRQQENERDKPAIAALEKAVSIDPSHLDAWLALSISYTNEHHRVDAYRCLEQWIAHHPRYKDLPHHHSQDEQHIAITRLFLEAARESPGQVDADVQIGLGVLLNLSQEYEKAMDCFKAALVTRPEDYQLWNKVGAILQKTGNTNGALEMYMNALEMNPLYARARYNLAVSYMHLGQYKEATEEFLTVLELQKTAEVGSNETNESIWNSLRLLMFMMNLDFLAQKCVHQELDAFREHFTF